MEPGFIGTGGKLLRIDFVPHQKKTSLVLKNAHLPNIPPHLIGIQAAWLGATSLSEVLHCVKVSARGIGKCREV